MNRIEYIRETAMRNGKWLILVSAIGGFVADVLQPIAPFAAGIFIISALVSLALLLALLLRVSNERLLLALLISFALTVTSGSLYGFQRLTKAENGVAASFVPGIDSLLERMGVIQTDLLNIEAENGEILSTANTINENVVELGRNVTRIAQLGGLIAEPDLPEDYLNNAEVYTRRGANGMALDSYERYFEKAKNAWYDAYDDYLAVLEATLSSSRLSKRLNNLEAILVTEGGDLANIRLLQAEIAEPSLQGTLLHEQLAAYPDHLPSYIVLLGSFSQTDIIGKTKSIDVLRMLRVNIEPDAAKRFYRSLSNAEKAQIDAYFNKPIPEFDDLLTTSLVVGTNGPVLYTTLIDAQDATEVLFKFTSGGEVSVPLYHDGMSTSASGGLLLVPDNCQIPVDRETCSTVPIGKLRIEKAGDLEASVIVVTEDGEHLTLTDSYRLSVPKFLVTLTSLTNTQGSFHVIILENHSELSISADGMKFVPMSVEKTHASSFKKFTVPLTSIWPDGIANVRSSLFLRDYSGQVTETKIICNWRSGCFADYAYLEWD